METVPFLRDVDDEKHYAQLLEVAYVEAFSEVDSILKQSELATLGLAGSTPEEYTLVVSYEDLARLREVMNFTVIQSVDRRRRLAHVARRLADVVLDKEGTKE